MKRDFIYRFNLNSTLENVNPVNEQIRKYFALEKHPHHRRKNSCALHNVPSILAMMI